MGVVNFGKITVGTFLYNCNGLPRSCDTKIVSTCSCGCGQTEERTTETVICYAGHDYFFTYKPASMVAAASILFSLQNCVSRSVKENMESARELAAVEKITRDCRTCLQILTHAAAPELDMCCSVLSRVVPEEILTGRADQVSPDTTVVSDTAHEDILTSTPSRSSSSASYYSATDLFSEVSSSTSSSNPTHQPQPFITSAVDVFTDFNTVLENTLSQPDSYSSILLSL